MKNTITLYALTAVLLMCCPSPPAAAAAPQAEHRFISALEAYKNGDYGAAVEAFETLTAQGFCNGELYYNLGNAYLKNNDLGRALLWYERALTLTPDDPDLRFNYDYARSLAKDAQEETAAPLLRILFFWKYQLGAGAVKTAALALNALFWAFIIAWLITGRRGARRAAWITAVLAALFILTALFNYHEAARRQQAVVLPEQVAVRSGLEETATELFKLHAGAKVLVVKTLDQHVQIRFSDDKIGWVPEHHIGRI